MVPSIYPASYPASLPGPQSAPLTPAERRVLTDLDGKRGARASSVDRLATQQLSWTFLRGEQIDTWLAWGRDDIAEWGAWFAASWSQPQGGVAMRRFVGAPAYPEYLYRVGWRVTATVQIRGRGALPNVPDPG